MIREIATAARDFIALATFLTMVIVIASLAAGA
jgi:hypothetical protein